MQNTPTALFGYVSILCCALISHNIFAQSKLRYSKLTPEDGLTSNYANVALQDRYGFIWLGTQNGLNRYDGYEIKAYLPVLDDTTSLSGSNVTSLYEDKDGNLWIGTWSNGLNLFDRTTETFRRFVHIPGDSTSLSSNSMVGFQLILEDSQNNFWVGTDDGINLMDRKTFEFTDVPIGMNLYSDVPIDKSVAYRVDFRAARRIRGLHVDRLNNFWVGTDWGGLYKYDYKMKTFEGFYPEPGNPESIEHITPGVFVEDKNGDLWILNYWHGINKLDLTTGCFQRFPNEPSNPNSLVANRPMNGFLYDDDQLWIGTSSGLMTFDITQETLQRVEPGNKDLQGYVQPLKIDEQGNFWFTTETGILIMTDTRGGFTHLLHQKDDPESISPHTGMIGVDSKGMVYVATNSAVDILDGDKRRIKTIAIAPGDLRGRTREVFNCILEQRSGEMLFCGVQPYVLNHSSQYLEYALPVDDYPTRGFTGDLYEDAEGNIWYGGHGLAVYNPTYQDFDRYDPGGEGNFGSNTIYTILELDSNQILVGGSFDGLMQFHLSKRAFTKRYPLGSVEQGTTVEINSTFRSSDGRIWVTSNYGLSQFNDIKGTYKHYGMQQGLPSNYASAILEDDHQNLWIATSNGISRFDPVNESFRNYNHQDGLPGNEFFSGHTSFKHPVTGELWFSGPNGITVFHPDSLSDNTYVPPVLLTRVTHINPNKGQPVTDHLVYNKKHLHFSYYDCIIEFEFAALNFVAPEKNTYAYRLDRFNEDWVYIGTKRDVTFTNLRPGSYVFRVKAANNDGVWNEEGLAIDITIAPPWWRTWLAYILYLLTFLFLGYTIHRYQKQRTIRQERERSQKRELQQAKEIEKAYRDLESTHQELAVTHENLKATQVQLIQREKMASLGEMTAGIAHEIQNPLNFVNNFAEVNKELLEEMQQEITTNNYNEAENISRYVIDNEEKIIFHGKRADAIVKSMLQHSRGSTGQKELTDINTLADEYLRLAYHGLRAKDKTFNAEFHTELDPSLPKIEVIPQDIGRVLLNLINNAFYACTERAKPTSHKASSVEDGQRLTANGDQKSSAGSQQSTVHSQSALANASEDDAANSQQLTADGEKQSSVSSPQSSARSQKPEASSQYQPTVTVSTKNLGDKIEIRVKDNGIGITDAIKDKIFQPFFTTKPTGQGTGLGLSLAYDIITKGHGGTLTVESTAGEGAVFIIRLPL